MTALDKRLHAYRDDLADSALRGKVEAAAFVDPQPAIVTASVCDMLAEPDAAAGLQTQAQRGEALKVFERHDGWAWVQRERDAYVGHVREADIGDSITALTHHVLAPRTFVYTEPDLKSPRLDFLSMGAGVAIAGTETRRGTGYCVLTDGSAVIAKHLVARDDRQDDPVAVALTLLRTPYLWGGDTAFGIDCSGLVALSHRMCGIHVMRDSDMQARTFGKVLSDGTDLRRGDLVFWKGHVGMMADGETLLHANGHTMDVALEPLAEAIDRIGYLYGEPTGFRRL